MTLIKDGEIVEDRFTRADDEAALDDATPVIVSLGRWTAEKDALSTRSGALGVFLKSDETAEAIAADLDRFEVVALEVPAFKDGRFYTTARLLRTRYGFTGEIRAVGDVLIDQYGFMRRCGVNAVETPSGADAEAWRRAAETFSVFYQNAADSRQTAAALRQDAARRKAVNAA